MGECDGQPLARFLLLISPPFQFLLTLTFQSFSHVMPVHLLSLLLNEIGIKRSAKYLHSKLTSAGKIKIIGLSSALKQFSDFINC